MYCAHGKKQKQILPPAGIFFGCFLIIAACGQNDSAIRINELYPRAQPDCPEWLELANVSAAAVNIRNWKFGNPDDTCIITAADFSIPAKGFAVLAKDRALFSAKYPGITLVVQPQRWHTLDNYHDTLWLWDSASAVCDRAGWDYRWFGDWTDQPLARVLMTTSGLLRDAWVVASKPSPGQPNSDVSWRSDGASLDIGPIPFTPNGDGKDDYLAITLHLPAAASAIVSIYGFDGRKYLELPQPPSSVFLWNGNSSGGACIPVGPFFVVAEVTNNGNKQILRKKGILWR